MLAAMQAFFSCLFIRFNLISAKGIVLAISFAIYMALIVVVKLYDLYSRKAKTLIRTEAVIAVALGVVAGIILQITEGASAIPFVILECLLTVIVYIIWMRIMKLWFKRHFCPHTYVCIGDNDYEIGGLMEMNRLDSNIFSSGKYFESGDEQGVIEYMELFKVGIMVLSDVSQDIYRNMLGICYRLNAMAFMIEKPQLPEYESSIREVYIGDRKLWLYLPLK